MLNLSRRCVGFLRSLSLRGCKSVGDGALRYCLELSICMCIIAVDLNFHEKN